MLKSEIIILSNYNGKSEGFVKMATGLTTADPLKYSQTEERALANAWNFRGNNYRVGPPKSPLISSVGGLHEYIIVRLLLHTLLNFKRSYIKPSYHILSKDL